MSKLTIYCSQLRKEEKSLYLEAKEQGIDCSYVLMRDGLKLDQSPTVGVLRVLGHKDSVVLANMIQLTNGIPINSVDIIKYCTDKSLTALLLQKHNIPQPRFKIAFSLKHLKELAVESEFSFVVKPVSASWGRGICLIKSNKCMMDWLAGRESLDASNSEGYPLLLQEYIDKPGFDIRVIVVGKKPIVAFKRVSEHWITNTHLGATVEPLTIDHKMLDIIKQITKVLGRGFYGIDLFKTKGG